MSKDYSIAFFAGFFSIKLFYGTLGLATGIATAYIAKSIISGLLISGLSQLLLSVAAITLGFSAASSSLAGLKSGSQKTQLISAAEYFLYASSFASMTSLMVWSGSHILANTPTSTLHNFWMFFIALLIQNLLLFVSGLLCLAIFYMTITAFWKLITK